MLGGWNSSLANVLSDFQKLNACLASRFNFGIPENLRLKRLFHLEFRNISNFLELR
jgi:hypothetical protein